MRSLVFALALVSVVSLSIRPAAAHGDEPHPKCKKGYVLTDDHKCVKKD